LDNGTGDKRRKERKKERKGKKAVRVLQNFEKQHMMFYTRLQTRGNRKQLTTGVLDARE
jgi:hypothetical protein